MKKIIYVLILSIFLLGNYFGYLLIENKASIDFLFKDMLTVKIKINDDFNEKDFLNTVKVFSQENNANFSQYTFIDDTELNIYVSNIENASNINIISGSKPREDYYLDNSREKSKKKSGTISFPSSHWSVKIYNLDQVNNVSLSDTFYVEGLNSTDKYKRFLKEFKSYEILSISKTKVGILNYINYPIFITILLCLLVYILCIFYYVLYNKKNLLVYKFWGYSIWRNLFYIPRKFSRLIFITILALVFFLVIDIIIKSNQYYLGFIFTSFIIINTILGICLIVPMIVFTLIISLSSKNSSTKIGNISTKKLLAINIISKSVFLILFLCIFSNLIQSFNSLNKMIENVSYWNKTKNVFRVKVGALPDNLNDKLSEDRKLNNKFDLFYKSGAEKNNMFIIDSENFNRLSNNKYSYESTIKDKSELNSYKGKRITIDSNYLKINPIIALDGENVLSKVIAEDNIINIVVPISENKFERYIKQNYLDWFYFQKIEVCNIYNEAIKIAKVQLQKKDLKVNIIYAKDNQTYFTFNKDTGDLRSSIIDPISIIYTNNLDTSYIGALITSSVYFLDNTKGNAFSSIKPIIEKTNSYEITNSISVYSEANKQIVKLKWDIYQIIIGVSITFIMILLLSITLIWIYYKSNIYRLLINNVFGYSILYNNRYLLSINILINIFATITSFIIYKEIVIWIIAFLVSGIDLIIIYLVSQQILSKDIKNVLKGENI